MKFKFNISLFKEKHESAGVAIGDAHIRVMQLTGSLAEAHLQAFAESALPKTIVTADGKVDEQSLAATLEKLFLKPTFGMFTTRDVSVNLPEAKCFVRVIHVSPMSDSEIDAAVPFEAESYIPIPIDQVYLDWQRLGEKDGRVELLLVASPKVFVDQVLRAVKRAGLTPVALEVGSQALARALVPIGEENSMLIIDMKATGTDLSMVERENIQFTSTIPIAGASVTEAIAKGLDVEAARAEEIKEQAGLANTEEYPNLKTLLLPVVNSFVSEIKQVLAFHDQHSAAQVTKIYLVGGSARLKHLPELLTEALSDRPNLTVQVADPTVNIHMDVPEKLGNGAILAYAGAVGLAMRPFLDQAKKEVNLLPRPEQDQLYLRTWYTSLVRLFVLGGLSFAVVGLVYVGVWVYLVQAQKSLQTETEQLQVQSAKPENAVYKKQVRLVNNYIADYNTLAGAAPRWSNMYREIARLVPLGMQVQNISVDNTKRQVFLAGSSPTRELVIELHDKIAEDTGYFMNVDYPLENVAKPENINFHYSFTVNESVLK